MKITIRNLLSGSQRLKFISFLFFIIFFNSGITISKNIDDGYVTGWKFYSKQNTSQFFSNDSIYFLIVKNNKSCQNCFQTLTDYLLVLQKKYPFQLHSVSHSDSTSLERKRNIYELTILFPGFQAYSVTYSEKWNDNTPTPELVIIKKNQFYLFSYQDLFSEGFGFISTTVQTKINAILNSE